MIRSMTGFGAGTAESDGETVVVELRSVNSRHLKLNFRLPPGCDRWESDLREAIAGRLARGHVDVTVRLDSGVDGKSKYRLDRERALALVEGLRELQRELGLAGDVSIGTLAASERLIVEDTAVPGEGLGAAVVVEAAEAALGQLVAMRSREGDRLEVDLRQRIEEIRRHLDVVEAQAPLRLESERERLKAAVVEVTAGVSLDEDRLLREVALIADRWDVGEEMVRARAHLDAFLELMDGPDEEAVGKRFGFLSQELLREINTTGSKANDVRMSRHVVEMKNELESLREQIENIE